MCDLCFTAYLRCGQPFANTLHRRGGGMGCKFVHDTLSWRILTGHTLPIACAQDEFIGIILIKYNVAMPLLVPRCSRYSSVGLMMLLVLLRQFIGGADAFPQRGIPPGLCRLLEEVQVPFVRRQGGLRCIPVDPVEAFRVLARNPANSIVRWCCS